MAPNLKSSSNINIVGLKLGMNSEEVLNYIQSNRSYLRKIGDKNLGDLFQGNDGVTNLSIRFAGGNHGNIQREFLSVIFESGTYEDYIDEGENLKSMIIGREINYNHDGYPHVNTFVSQLIKKYGSPSRQRSVDSGAFTEHKLLWNLDQTGNLITNTGDGPCDPFYQNRPNSIKDFEDFVYLPFRTNYEKQGKYFVPPKVSPKCGVTLFVIGYDQGGTIRSFKSVLYHQSAITADRWQRDMIAINQAKRKTQKAVESSKSQQLDF